MKTSHLILGFALCLGLSQLARGADEPTYIAPRKEPAPHIHDRANAVTFDTATRNPANGFLIDAGVGAGLGLHAPGAVWGIGGEYRFAADHLPDRMALKALADVNFGYGTDLTQFLEIGGGFNWYLGDMAGTDIRRAYITTDIGIGDATNAVTGHTATSAVIGVGGSYTFHHTPLVDFNALIHYAILLNQVDRATPSLLTFRVGMAF